MFTEYKITLSDTLGTDVVKQISGQSVVVVSIPLYDSIDDVPKMLFDSSEPEQPLYPKSVYVKPCTGFKSLTFKNTSDSLSNSIIILVSDSRMEESISINETAKNFTGKTFDKTSSDVVQTLASTDYTSNGQLAESMLITSNGADILYAFDVDPVQDGLGHLLSDSDTIKIEGISFIQNFRFLSKTASTPSTVNFTMQF